MNAGRKVARIVCRPCLVPGIAVLVAIASGTTFGADRTVLAGWTFGQANSWHGWSPNAEICDATFEKDQAVFRTLGNDPQLLGPLFELPRASNAQWVEIEMDCDAPGSGELFYTNKTTGQYGGLEPAWMGRIDVPATGPQVVTVWPFWGSLGKIIRLRFDPPSGVRCRLRGIRIVETAGPLPKPQWSFDGPTDSWHAMYAARLERAGGKLNAQALSPQAVMVTPVAPFDAAKRSILRLDAECAGEQLIGLHWVTAEQPGLFGEPIFLTQGRINSRSPIDLRRFPGWAGQITHLAISFGTSGREALGIDAMSIEDNKPDRPFLRLKYLGFARAINRPGRPAEVRIILEHGGGPALPACKATLAADTKADCGGPTFDVPAVAPGGRFEILRPITPRDAGRTTLGLTVNEQTFSRSLRIDPPAGKIERGDYSVPPPRLVKTKYDIGVYYFPGWSPDQISRWQKQADFPERDPVLGWYEEGRPEVADWHIKWCVENAISFFVFDWYWRKGKEDLTAGLNDGFLKARYCERMKFAIMWANHAPFSEHTPEQLLAVTDYWIEHYLRRANYFKLNGVPYVSFFHPAELISCLGSEDKTREALAAMRERVRATGLPGLHIAACTGSNPREQEHLKRAGFDSLTAYNYVRTGTSTAQSPYRQFLLGHEAIWQAMQREGVLPYVPLMGVGWDSRPWHGPRAEARFARRTEDFAEGLKRLKANLDATGSRVAILEAWNEWGEGSYIEPNVEFGFQDLEDIRATFAEPGEWPTNIGPDDVGLSGAYDLRRRPTTSAAAP